MSFLSLFATLYPARSFFSFFSPTCLEPSLEVWWACRASARDSWAVPEFPSPEISTTFPLLEVSSTLLQEKPHSTFPRCQSTTQSPQACLRTWTWTSKPTTQCTRTPCSERDGWRWRSTSWEREERSRDRWWSVWVRYNVNRKWMIRWDE